MSYVPYEKLEGLPDVEALAILMPDASATMAEPELQTGEPKHLCIARMIQQILNRTDDPQYGHVILTGAFFSADATGVKILSFLSGHNPFEEKTYSGNTSLDYWDGLSAQNRTQGMGNQTPLGTALAWAREQAEQWVNASTGQVQRRAVIYLLSDGMNNYGPDGMEERAAIEAFNAVSEKGRIRLATIGYFQTKEGEGTRPEEEAGRRLLRALPLNKDAYFEANNVQDIVRYILSTMTQLTK